MGRNQCSHVDRLKLLNLNLKGLKPWSLLSGIWGLKGAVWLTKPLPSAPHHHQHTPPSLLHPRPTGDRQLSYCAFCKTWLNLINAVDFKQNHIWAEEGKRERDREGQGERERERGGNSQRWEQIGPVRSLRGFNRLRGWKYFTLEEYSFKCES